MLIIFVSIFCVFLFVGLVAVAVVVYRKWRADQGRVMDPDLVDFNVVNNNDQNQMLPNSILKVMSPEEI